MSTTSNATATATAAAATASPNDGTMLTRSQCTGECPSNCLEKHRHKRYSKVTSARVIKEEELTSDQHQHHHHHQSSTTSSSSSRVRSTRLNSTEHVSNNNNNNNAKSKTTRRRALVELSDDEAISDDLGEADEIVIRNTTNKFITSIESSSRKMQSVHQKLTGRYKIFLLLFMSLIPFIILLFTMKGSFLSSFVQTTSHHLNPVSHDASSYMPQQVPRSSSNEPYPPSNPSQCNVTTVCPSFEEVRLLNIRLDSLEKLLLDLKIAYENIPQPKEPHDFTVDINALRQEQLAKYDQIDKQFRSISHKINDLYELNQLRAASEPAESRKAPETNCSMNTPSIEEIESKIRQALQIYDADKTGMADYALESSGGSIVSTRCSETYEPYIAKYSIWNIPIWYTSNSPRVVIQSSMAPGECWPFVGSNGRLVIKLSAMIIPTHFHYEHISKALSREGDIRSAPKDFQVYGLQDERDPNGILLGNFQYQDNGVPLQKFEVQINKGRPFQYVELVFFSNHGHPDYTCLYRFRVHGRRV